MYSADMIPETVPDPTGRAGKAKRFLETLTLWEGDYAGQPMRILPYQEYILRRIYGPSHPDGRRRVTTAAIWLPRGNAKTALGAGLALAHLCGPFAEDGGQVIFAAADRENANIAFRHAHEMGQRNTRIARQLEPVVSRSLIRHPRSSGRLTAISSEAYSKHGLNASFFLADELHQWPPQTARDLWDAVQDSMIKRRSPLTVIISTAGRDEGGLAWEMWQYSKAILSGAVKNDSWAVIMLTPEKPDRDADPDAPRDYDWSDERLWRQVSPGLDAGIINWDGFRDRARRAANDPVALSSFKRFYLNDWISGAPDPWVDIAVYDRAEPIRAPHVLLGLPCYVGIDLSSVEDLTAVVVVFPDPESDGAGQRYDVLAHFFLPEDRIGKKSDEDQAAYLRWEKDGHLTLTEGNVVDYDRVVAHLVDIGRQYDVREYAIDRWNSTSVITKMHDEDMEVSTFGMGFASMAAPVRELKRAILAGHFRHGRNPVLRYCFANVAADIDPAENEKFTKRDQKLRGRIDGAVAAAIAVGRWLLSEEPEDFSGEIIFV